MRKIQKILKGHNAQSKEKTLFVFNPIQDSTQKQGVIENWNLSYPNGAYTNLRKQEGIWNNFPVRFHNFFNTKKMYLEKFHNAKIPRFIHSFMKLLNLYYVSFQIERGSFPWRMIIKITIQWMKQYRCMTNLQKLT